MSTPTGEQFELEAASGSRRSRAIITEVAAGLRALSIDGIDLVETYPGSAVPPYGSGIVLVPWPNRVEDGVWLHHGEKQQLDLTEPERHNAIHGLLRQAAYRVASRSAQAITLAATVFPQHGYPFQLDTTVRYELVADGLKVTHEIWNVGENAAPVAVGAHPYLRLGDVPTEDLVLTLPAGTHLKADDRNNVRSEHPVDGTEFDLRNGVRVGDVLLDDGFGDVGADAAHRLTAPDGRYVELWRDADFAFVQVFTKPDFPKDGGFGLAIAVEPMTAPGNAFNNGSGLRWLQPGERWTLSWGIRYSGQPAGE
ncbi:MAG: hypothetical protein JWL94_346 [Microbacteriaceae bacterium]|jgi:aldose 1-epimerase|nr:hypothetical protein [Microbacteriaceae bacterium]HEV7957813.1 aldose 1-epimerase family protein [Marisediminicola sp.]